MPSCIACHLFLLLTILLGERVREALEARMVKSENWRCIPELKDFKVHIHPKAWLDCMPTSPVYSNPSKIRRLCDQPLSAMHLSHCSDMHGKRPPLRRYFKKKDTSVDMRNNQLDEFQCDQRVPASSDSSGIKRYYQDKKPETIVISDEEIELFPWVFNLDIMA